MVIVDSHCHLSSSEYSGCIEEKVRKAKLMDVRYMLTVSTCWEDIHTNIEIAHCYDNVFCSVGIHPSHFDKSVTLDSFVGLLNDDRVVAIGEVGLDFYYKDICEIDQKGFLIDILDISHGHGLPYIFHARSCYPDIFDILKGYDGIEGVFHCYTDNLENARIILDMGFYISMSGIITFKKSDDLREVLRYIPNDRLLVETDCPYLAPVPMRGKVNEPAYVRLVAERVAEEKGIALEELAELTTNNFFRLFKKGKRVE